MANVTFQDTLEATVNGASSKTASQYAATDLVPLFNSSGELIGKISRTELMSAVQTSLGSLLNGGTAQTSITKVPSLNGNTLGAITPANLASVLGALTLGDVRQSGSVSVNSIKEVGVHSILGSDTDQPASSTNGGILLVLKRNSDGLQIFTDRNTKAVYYRYQQNVMNDGESWSAAWGRMDNFGCTTSAELATLLGASIEELTGNESVLDSLDNKKYNVKNISITGIGTVYGILENTRAGIGGSQTLFCYNSTFRDHVYMRTYNSNGWSPWKSFELV